MILRLGWWNRNFNLKFLNCVSKLICLSNSNYRPNTFHKNLILCILLESKSSWNWFKCLNTLTEQLIFLPNNLLLQQRTWCNVCTAVQNTFGTNFVKVILMILFNNCSICKSFSLQWCLRADRMKSAGLSLGE